jgi:D-glycero-alpha-D-manno-heptose-7-phosphate kinase
VSYRRRPKLVSTAAPLRISYAGGGTDFPDHYLVHGGRVLSTTIDRFVYVTVNRREHGLFDERYRLSYFEAESVQTLDEIRNETARECLKLVPVDEPLHISTSSDVPASSGLGSSSSFAVALLLALHELRGDVVSSGQLADEACEVEIQRLGRPIGKQDQFAAAFGGLNSIAFDTSGRVTVHPLWLPDGGIKVLFDSTALVWTGVQRPSQSVLSEQKSRVVRNTASLAALTELAVDCERLIAEGHRVAEGLGAILRRGWELKRGLASNVADGGIDQLAHIADESGAWGSKICGAGAGGFLLVLAEPQKMAKLEGAVAPRAVIRPTYEPRGARVIAVL